MANITLGMMLHTAGNEPLGTTSGKLHVRASEMETLLTTIVGHVDGLEAKDFATETTLASVLGAVDGLEAKDYATQTTLAAVLTAVDQLETKVDAVTTAITAIKDTVGIKKIVDPIPAGTNNIGSVSLSDRIVASTVLQNAATTAVNGSAFTNAGGSKNVTVELKGTSASRAWAFEMAGPSGVYVATTGFNPNTYTTATGSAGGSDTVPETWQFTVPPGWSLRTRLSTAPSGGNATATAYQEVA